MPSFLLATPKCLAAALAVVPSPKLAWRRGMMLPLACAACLFVEQSLSAEVVTFTHDGLMGTQSTITVTEETVTFAHNNPGFETSTLVIGAEPSRVVEDAVGRRAFWEVISYEHTITHLTGTLSFVNNPEESLEAVTLFALDGAPGNRGLDQFFYPGHQFIGVTGVPVPTPEEGGFGDLFMVTEASGDYGSAELILYGGMRFVPGLSNTNTFGSHGFPTTHFRSFADAILYTPSGEDGPGAAPVSVFWSLRPIANEVLWAEPVGGSFGDAQRWDPQRVPESDDTIVFNQEGVYDVTMVSNAVVNAARLDQGTVTFDLAAGRLDIKETLLLGGRMDLRSGEIQVGFEPLSAEATAKSAVSLRDGATLTVGGGTSMRVGFDVVTRELALADLPFASLTTAGSTSTEVETIEVIDGGNLVADGIRLSTADTAAAAPLGTSVVADGAGSEISVLNLHAAEGQGSFAELIVQNGAKLRVGRQATFADSANSEAAVVVSGEGSEITALVDAPLGPLQVVVANRGRATIDVRDHANVLLGGSMVIGAESGAMGRVGFDSAATLTLPNDFATNVIVGDDGSGSLSFQGDAQFLSSALENGMPSSLVLGNQARGDGALMMTGAGTEPAATTFAATAVGLGGRGSLELSGGALFATGRLDVGTELDAEGAIHVDGPSTIFSITDLNFARIGVEGRGELVLSNGATFAVSDDPALPIDPTFVLDSVSIGVGRGEGIVRVESGAEFRAGVGRQDTDILGNPLPERLLSKVLVGTNADGGSGRLVVKDALAEMSVLSIGVRAGRPTTPPDDGVDRAGSVAVESGELLAHDLIGIGAEGLLRLSSGALTRTKLLSLAPEPDGLASSPGAEVIVEGFGSHLEVQGGVHLQIGANTQLARMRVREEGALRAQEIDARGASVLEISSGGDANVAVDVLVGRATLAGDLTDAIISVDGLGSELIVGQTLFVGDSAAPPTATASGLVDISDGGRVVADRVQLERGGTVTGSGGTLIAKTTVLAGGTISPGQSPGILTFEGDVRFEPGSILEIEISGTEAGTEHDLLEVMGDLMIDGQVVLKFIDSFAPQQGQTFNFLMTEGLYDQGPNAEFLIQNLAPGFEFDVSMTGNLLSLAALNDGMYIPEPSTLLLGAVGILALALHRRHSDAR